MKHTPGPWDIDTSHGIVVGPCRIRMGTANNTDKRARAFADARLIAAAPDLLDVLQNAEQVIAESQGETIPEEWADLLDEIRATLLDDIRAAIAKATGEPRK